MALSFRVVTVTDVPTKLSTDPGDNRSDASFVCAPRGDVTLGPDNTVAVGSAGTVGPTGDLATYSAALQAGEQVWAVAPATTTVQVAVWEGGV